MKFTLPVFYSVDQILGLIKRKIQSQNCKNIYKVGKVEVKLCYTIRSVPYLTHNIINKNFDRLTLLCKIIPQNSKIILALFQLNHINKYPPDYEDLITSL